MTKQITSGTTKHSPIIGASYLNETFLRSNSRVSIQKESIDEAVNKVHRSGNYVLENRSRHSRQSGQNSAAHDMR